MRRAALRVAVAGAVVVALVAAGAPGLVASLAGRVAVSWAMRGVPRDVVVVDALAGEPEDGPLVFLVVGSDTRGELPAGAVDAFGPLTGERADAIALVAIDRERRAARVLSLPRDLAVDVEPFGTLILAEVLGFAGSAELVAAVRAATGLPVHHYAEVTFAGFASLVDALGGVAVDLPRPSRDLTTGFRAAAGVQVLDGEAALALARSREFEEERAGAWEPAAAGDAGRIERQHLLAEALVVRAGDGLSPAQVVRLLRRAPSPAMVDGRLGAGDVLAVARIIREGDVEMRVYPARPRRPVAELLSPFGPPHYGGRPYLEAGEGAVAALAWLAGADS